MRVLDDETTARARVVARNWKPRNCVWELTLACNLDCAHCGTSAGKVRRDELSLEQCLDVAEQLADQGCELVTLSGGEPTLRKGWDRIARALADRGVYVNMVTNGVYRSEAVGRDIAARARDAGMCNIAVSLDGPRNVHEILRGPGTFDRTLEGVGYFREAGLPVAVLTTVSRLNLPLLEQVREIAIDAGAKQWRLQLAKPMGRMDDLRDLVIDPTDLLDLVPRLARMKKAGRINLRVGDSIGYYGPHDKVLRGRGWRGGRQECWQGCQAGMQAIGIEADGGVKGCLSLQAKWGESDPFVEASLREHTLDEIWHAPGIFPFNRDFSVDQLTGGCAPCRHAALCRGGARCVSSAVNGTVTDDPYCYYRVASERRALEIQRRPPSTCVAAAALALSIAACDDTSSSRTDASASPPRDVVVVADGATDGSPPDGSGGLDAVVADALPDGQAADFPTPDALAVDGPLLDQAVPDLAVSDGPASDGPASDGPVSDGPVPDVAPPDQSLPDVAVADASPDVSAPDAAVDCGAVCCECEYGVIPEEVWEACCAPDPCANACCECDYGDPPPAECCP